MSVKSHFYKRARFLLILNPVAGRRRRQAAHRALEALREAGVEVEEYISVCAGDAEARAREAAVEYPPPAGIIAAGGDGTLNEIVNAVAGTDVPVGLLPLGTANVFALETDIPRRPAVWARAVLECPPMPVHLGTANGRHFVAMVSAGFDSRAVAEVNPLIKKRFGKVAYAVSGFRALATTASDRLDVSVDGARYEAGWAIVSKTRLYAGAYELVPTAGPDLAELGVTLFPVSGRMTRLRDLALLGLGRVRDVPGVQLLAGRDVTVDGTAMAAQMDGDMHTPLPVHVTPGPTVWFLGLRAVSEKTHVN